MIGKIKKINFYVLASDKLSERVNVEALWEHFHKSRPFSYFYSYLHWTDLLDVNYEIKNIDDEVIDDENNWHVLDLYGREEVTDISNFIIEKKVLNFIHKNKSVKLMIFLPQEGMALREQPFWYITFCEKYNISLERLYILQSAFLNFKKSSSIKWVQESPNFNKSGHSKLNKINWISDKFSTLYFWTLLFHTYGANRYVPPDNLRYKKRNKYFTFLNVALTYGGAPPRVKLFRLYPIAKLHSTGILNKGYYSLISRIDDKWRFDVDNTTFSKYKTKTDILEAYYKRFIRGDKKLAINQPLSLERKGALLRSFESQISDNTFKSDILKSTKKLLDLVPIYLPSEDDEEYLKKFIYDFHPVGVESGDFMYMIPKVEIEDSYFSVVTESGYEGTLLYGTEKSSKALLQLQPFILISTTGHLRDLQDMGFETFPELFDESYDEIEDNFERLEFICNEIERVCSMDIDELHEIYVRIFPKLLKNRKRFFSYNLKEIFESWFV